MNFGVYGAQHGVDAVEGGAAVEADYVGRFTLLELSRRVLGLEVSDGGMIYEACAAGLWRPDRAPIL